MPVLISRLEVLSLSSKNIFTASFCAKKYYGSNQPRESKEFIEWISHGPTLFMITSNNKVAQGTNAKNQFHE